MYNMAVPSCSTVSHPVVEVEPSGTADVFEGDTVHLDCTVPPDTPLNNSYLFLRSTS